MSLSAAQKGAITRRINVLREKLSTYRADRGLREHLSPDDVARNEKFLANIQRDLAALEAQRRAG